MVNNFLILLTSQKRRNRICGTGGGRGEEGGDIGREYKVVGLGESI
jgi:hypothetical protein